MEVYADVLVTVNYVVDLLLLLAVVKIQGAVVSRNRLCLGALVGALSSLSIFLPYIGWWFQGGMKLLLAAGMGAVVFGLNPMSRFWKGFLLLLVMSFVLAGGLLALYWFVAPVGMLYYNGVVYFDLSPLLLVGCVGGVYVILCLLERLFQGHKGDSRIYQVSIWVNGKTVSCKGLTDTGSSLREPFSGAPVIVCDRELARKVWPNDQKSFRVIPCLTVNGESALEGFQPEFVRIEGNGKTIQTRDCYIACSKQPIQGAYQALINPQMVGEDGLLG